MACYSVGRENGDSYLQALYGEIDTDSCSHLETSGATCLRCGAFLPTLLSGKDSVIEVLEEEMEGDCVKVLTADKGILSDLKPYRCFPEEVKLKANDIYKQMVPKTYKQSCRKHMLIHVICEAYFLLGSPKDPRIIASYFGEDVRTASKAYNNCHYVYSGYRDSYSRADAIDYIPHYANRLGFQSKEIIEEIIESSQDIFYTFFEDLEDETPQFVTIGLLYYYCVQNGYTTVTMERACQASMLSEAIVTEYYKIILRLTQNESPS